MSISLIANSGIQFHKFQISFNPNDPAFRAIGFYEKIDLKAATTTIEYAYYVPDEDIWVPKKVLKDEGYLDDNDNLLEKYNKGFVRSFKLRDEKDYYSKSSLSDCITDFENLWIPIPYFKQTLSGKCEFGPISWARMLIKADTAANNNVNTSQKQYNVVLAFDTRIDEQNLHYFTPREADTVDRNNIFALSNSEDLNLNFCDSNFHCGWVDKALREIVMNGEERTEFPCHPHVASYLYLIKNLETLKVFPTVTLHTEKQESIEVDLVLDIGNSNTCGILFESPGKGDLFEFTSVKKLMLQDLSFPENQYDEPFSMRLAFVEGKLGDIDNPEYKNGFRWPSIVRLGEEAKRFISIFNVDKDKGRETATHHSSPKRYLWDDKKADIQWEFIPNIKKYFWNDSVKRYVWELDPTVYKKKKVQQIEEWIKEVDKTFKETRTVYCEGISEQFYENGEFAYSGNSGALTYYSRKSLMTFVYIEIFLHALAQINSHEFRYAHGKPEIPRKLKRITITCPTSIVQKEQVVLRACAEDAVRALSRFFSNTFLGTIDPDDDKSDLEIIPSPRDLGKKLSQIDNRKDWIYDEATCCQMVFLFGEVSKRYLNNAEMFFNLYGKKRADVIDSSTKSLTIGTLDMGGGTTDLMICAYQYAPEQSNAIITPIPLFWESYNLAGDDLLKEIVHQIVLAGKESPTGEDIGCAGVIENAARRAGVANVAEKMQNFFGLNANPQTYLKRIYRKNFVVQVAVPIALHYLKHTIDGEKDEITLTFNDLFPDTKPNAELIKQFNNHFAPLVFENIEWKLSKRMVNKIIDTTLDPMLKQLSTLMSAYGCDFVLLAGKPTTIPKIREMFVKYYPTSPDRIITLKDYRVGRWYPFANDVGEFEDPKTIVSVGALVALMGGKLDKLRGFRLNTEYLKRNLISTSEYIGQLNTFTLNIDYVAISPDENVGEIELHSLPLVLGYKQLPNDSCIGRAIYNLDLNEDTIKERKLEEEPNLMNDPLALQNAINAEKTKFRSKMPLTVNLRRQYNDSREHLTVETVKDKSNNPVSKSLLKLNIMTLSDERGYWLDNGEFVLNIKN